MNRRTRSISIGDEADMDAMPAVSHDTKTMCVEEPAMTSTFLRTPSRCPQTMPSESRPFSKTTVGGSSVNSMFVSINPLTRYKVDDLTNYTMTDQQWTLQRKKIGLTRRTSAAKQRKVINEQAKELTLNFIRSTFTKKECLKYGKDYARSKYLGYEICHCGLTTYDHHIYKQEFKAVRTQSSYLSSGRKFLTPLCPSSQGVSQRPSTLVEEVDETKDVGTGDDTETKPGEGHVNADGSLIIDILQANGITKRNKSKPTKTTRNVDTTTTRDSTFPLPLLPEVKGRWKKETCMGEFPTDAYGSITFMNETTGSNKPAKYVRMSDTTDMTNVMKLLTDYWRMMEPSRPNLVISVIGGAKNFRLDGKKKQTFNCGLIKAVKSTQAWILTGGMHVGVMKTVGDAVNEGQHIVKIKRKFLFAEEQEAMVRGIKCIGVASWGYVKDNHSLINEDPNYFSDVKYVMEDTAQKKKNVSLNGDHTHFLLVDSGIRNRYQGVDKFRIEMKSAIHAPEPIGLGVPVVVLLLDGGISSIVECAMALERNIPIVIVGNTGRAADLMGYAISMTIQTHSGQFVLRKGHKKQLYNRVVATLTELEESSVDYCVEKIIECCSNAHLITLYDINSCEGMDKYILYALLKGDNEDSEASRIDQLNLSFLWNRPDIAENDIFPSYPVWPSESLEDLMTNALIQEKVEFVQLIAANGLIIVDYLTVQRLRTLYNLCYSPDTHLGKLLVQCSNSSKIYLCDVHCLLKVLTKKHWDPVYSEDTSQNYHNDPSINYKTFEDPYRELLLWAVLSNRGKLAQYLWEKCNSPLIMAIVSTCIYRYLWMSLGAKNTEIREEYMTRRDLFEGRALQYLDACFKQDPTNSMGMVERRHKTWGDLDCLEIALNGNDLAFISSPCCQASVDINWRRGMIKAPTIAIILSIFMPFLVLTPLFKFQKLGDNKGNLKWFQKLIVFYRSPICKFLVHSLTYAIFLLVYAYVVLFEFRPQMSTMEKFIVVWVFTSMLEEIHEILSGDASTLEAKIADYWTSVWNRFDVCAYTLAIIAWILRLNPSTFKWGRVAYALNTNMYYIRLFRIYHVNYQLGPKLVIFYRMISEVLVFMALLLIFMFGYGIASQSLLHPWRTLEKTNLSTIVEGVFLTPYWQMYGELSLDKLEGIDEERCELHNAWETEVCENPKDYTIFSNMMLVFYLIIGNIMLLNLLIAIFSYVFDEVHENSMEIWKLEMYRLIREYDKKPMLVPPLVVLELLYRLLKYLWKRLCRKSRENLDDYMKETLRSLAIFEKEAMSNYLSKIKEIKEASMESIVTKMADKIEKISKYIEQEEELRAIEEDTECLSMCEDDTKQTIVPPNDDGKITPLKSKSSLHPSDKKEEESNDHFLSKEVEEQSEEEKEVNTCKIYMDGFASLPFALKSRPCSMISFSASPAVRPRSCRPLSGRAGHKHGNKPMDYLNNIANRVDSIQKSVEDIQKTTHRTLSKVLDRLDNIEKGSQH